jgi:hypothetical protein
MMGNVIRVPQNMGYVFRVPSMKKKVKITGIHFAHYTKQSPLSIHTCHLCTQLLILWFSSGNCCSQLGSSLVRSPEVK